MFIRDTWVRIDLRNKVMELFGVELRRVHSTSLEPVVFLNQYNEVSKEERDVTIDRNPVRYPLAAQSNYHQEFLAHFQRSGDAS